MSTKSDFVPFRIENGRSPQAAACDVVLPQKDRLFNRHLNWMLFNDRVLDEASGGDVPALERLRLAAIVSSNLDEFFMVRVAEVARIARRHPGHRFPDGLTAAQTLAQIREQVLRQKARQAVVLTDLLSLLKAEGIHVHHEFAKPSRLDRQIRARLPRLEISFRRSSEPLPALASGRIHIFVRFPGMYAIIALAEREGRLIALSSSGGSRRYVLAERWLCARAAGLFPEHEVIEAFPFKIIRDADLRYRPEDEDALEVQIVEAIEKRQRAKVVRLEVDNPSYSEGALFLAAALRIDSSGLYRFDLPLDLRTLALLYNDKGFKRLRYPPVNPHIPGPFRSGRSIFAAIRRQDILLHHPYDSFDIVINFLEAAAADPKVTHIYHTMYRTSRQSPVVAALKRAALSGKKVTVYIEIKARFDELNNVECANELRQAGVRVVRPLGRFKVHSKLTQVIRAEPEGPASYLHLGTGNYHPVTARQYTDLGLLTRDQSLGGETVSYFSAMSRGVHPSRFEELLVAPGNLHSQILNLIKEEIASHAAKGNGRIVAKMNSLVDPEIIEALYKASKAGVAVELLVRGICCLVPGIKGLSENIRVVSIIDRFLEHSRIYYFRAGGEEKLFLSSADWMPRNFYTRYELAFPVKDPDLKRYIRDVVLGHALADNVKAWVLKPDGSYARVQGSEAVKGQSRVRSQALFESLARRGYRNTILENR